MAQHCLVLLAVLNALSPFPMLAAQTASISIPAWVEKNGCEPEPKFEATLGDTAVPVTSQMGPMTDQLILVVFDLTGDLSLIEATKQAVIAEISKLPQNSWVGVLRAQNGLHVLADPGAERQPVIDAIQSISSKGEPGLLGTVESVLALGDVLIRKSAVRVSALYLTDGSIYNYREDYSNPVINQSDPNDLSRRFPEALVKEKISKLSEAARSLQTPLFVVHVNYRSDRLNRAYQDGLETLADATGGKSDMCRSFAEIPEAISEMFARITSAWRLTLEVPPKIHDNIEIRLRAPCNEADPRLSWRTRFNLKEGR